MINVLLVDDKNVGSEGLQLIINRETDMKVVGLVNNEEELMAALERFNPAVILFKSNFKPSKLTKHIFQYRKGHPKTKLIYTFNGFSNRVFYDAIKMRADGFLNESFPPNRFIAIIREVYDGEYVISGEIAHELFRGLHYIEDLKKIVLRKALAKRDIEVTMRDLDILYLLYLDKTNKEISEDLKIEGKSVRYYVSKSYKKLGCKNRTEVIAFLKEIID